MIDHSQTDPTALQGPQNRAQRSVEWIATDPKAGMTLDEMAAFVQNAMRADTAVLESLITGVGNSDQGHRGIPQPGAEREDRGREVMNERDIEETRARLAGDRKDPKGARVGKPMVGIVRFDVTIRRVDGAEIDAGVLAAPLRAGERDGKLQVEPLDLRAAFAEALDTAEERGPRATSTERRTDHG